MKTTRLRLWKLLFYLSSFLGVIALLLTFFYPVWCFPFGSRFPFEVPAAVPLWKADLNETCGLGLFLELILAGALALPLYLGFFELYRARHREA
jgi:hypothetical protein